MHWLISVNCKLQASIQNEMNLILESWKSKDKSDQKKKWWALTSPHELLREVSLPRSRPGPTTLRQSLKFNIRPNFGKKTARAFLKSPCPQNPYQAHLTFKVTKSNIHVHFHLVNKQMTGISLLRRNYQWKQVKKIFMKIFFNMEVIKFVAYLRQLKS